jgi:RNA polymerase sigma-70 factor (ECF subfamily)
MAADFHAELEALRPFLVRYASFTLRSRHAAEDAVQDTLLAALSVREEGFERRSSLRTWLTGILKHKCIDMVRRARREAPLPASDDDGLAGGVDALFDRRDHWHEHPAPWDTPEAALQQKEFLRVLEACLSRLPRRSAQVFLLREQLDCGVAEISRDLGLSAGNCAVVLHRSRMALRACLQENWFAR